LADSIRAALQATPQSGSLSSPELERAARAFATAAREAGTTPERTLVALATIITDATRNGTSDWWRSVVRDRLVVWAIEGYYNIDIE
jgi:hypothetical protein